MSKRPKEVTANTNILTWLQNNCQRGGKVNISTLFEASGCIVPGCRLSRMHFKGLVKTLFPHIQLIIKDVCSDGSKRRFSFFKGISLKNKNTVVLDHDCLSNPLLRLDELILHVPLKAMARISNDKLSIGLPSNVFLSGSPIVKQITISGASWELSVRNTTIILSDFGISNDFVPTKHCLDHVLQLVEVLNVCVGQEEDEDRTPRTGSFQECVTIDGEEKNIVRSRTCRSVYLPAISQTNVCKQCVSEKLWRQRRDIEINDDDNDESEDELIDVDQVMDKCFPNAPENMKVLLENQQQALTAAGQRGNRWHPTIISICLSILLHSPKAYRILRDSRLLILPSYTQLKSMGKKCKEKRLKAPGEKRRRMSEDSSTMEQNIKSENDFIINNENWHEN